MNEQLTRALKDKGDRFAEQHPADLSLDVVLRRAGEIRRGRRMRATMVMAAVVLAIAVPVGITVAGNSGTGTDGTDNHRKPLPATQPNHDPIGIGDLKTGDDPKAGYYSDGKLYAGGKAVASISQPSYLARIDGGFLVATSAGDSLRATFVGDDGTELGTDWPIDSGFVVSPEGSVGAFVEPDGTVIAVEGGGSRYFEVGTVPDASAEAGPFQAVALTGENCSGRSGEPGCTVYVESTGANTVIGAVSPHRDSVLVHPALRSLVGVSPQGYSAGIVSVTDEGSCSKVLDQVDDEVWKTCDYSFDAFSPDGEHLLAGPAYRDGFGSTQLAIFDSAGKRILDLRTEDRAALVGVQWDDNDHVLATVFDNNRWAVERIALDGSREYALPPVSGEDFDTKYLLAHR